MNVLSVLLPGFTGTALPDWLAQRLRAGLAGVCLFGPNIASPAQLRALTDAISAANPRAIIAIDEEGGDVTRLFAAVGSPDPGNAVLGRLDDLAATERSAGQIGRRLRAAGVNVDLAPSVDINTQSDNPIIGVRSFGRTPELVARHGAAWIAGLQATGLAATAKHFPGHGDTVADSHLSLPVVDRSLAELRERELAPFAAAIRAGTKLIMTSHLLLPQLDPERPATMSTPILVDLLRDELGFDGVIISDALDMAGARQGGGAGRAAVRALLGGCDLLCLGTNTTDDELVEIEAAVEAEVSAERVAEAARRVLGLADDLRVVSLSKHEQPFDPVPSDYEVEDQPWRDEELIKAFDIGPRAGAWSHRLADSQIIRLEPTPNTAVGPTPWDPFPDQIEQVVTPESVVPNVGPGPLIVVGRDIHQNLAGRRLVDQLRRTHDRLLVVDLGWPSDDRQYADLATFGSSTLIARALRAFLEPHSAC